ncbi:MAG: 23S rRNA (guanosine(2251)-2'-O)-methyltransferase RlmB [Clostridia bacterium]|nr:23S rRNA (guanosine(2251)-2'-O)-methyltransferase RlmB [Clostridia bacterium]
MENEQTETAIGRNGVRELLRSGKDIDKIFVAKGAAGAVISEIKAEARKRSIVVTEVSSSRLDELAGGSNHQGIIALVSQVDYADIDDIFSLAEERNEKPFIVICDEISDPHNLGAVIRCAEGAGCHGVIIPKRRAVGVSGVVAKASAGAVAHLPIVKVVNLARCVDSLKKRGIWVFSAEAGGKSCYDSDLDLPCAVIMGSEGRGVSKLLRDKSDFTVSIPMYGKVNSFNVSTAAAVILCEAAKQRHAKQ